MNSPAGGPTRKPAPRTLPAPRPAWSPNPLPENPPDRAGFFSLKTLVWNSVFGAVIWTAPWLAHACPLPAQADPATPKYLKQCCGRFKPAGVWCVFFEKQPLLPAPSEPWTL